MGTLRVVAARDAESGRPDVAMRDPLITGALVVILAYAWERLESRGIRVPVLTQLEAILGPVIVWAVIAGLVLLPVLVVALAFGPVYAVLISGGVGATIMGASALARRRRRSRPRPRTAVVLPERDPRAADYLHDEAWRLVQAGRHEAAAAKYEQAATLGDLDAMVNLANLLCDELDDPDRAEAWYERAIRSGSGAAAGNLAIYYLESGRTDEAHELFELARRRGESWSYIGLARIAWERDQPAQAVSLLETAILEGESAAYVELGTTLSLLGRQDDAIARLQEGLERDADGVVDLLDRLLRAEGKLAEADALRARGEPKRREWPAW